MSRAMTDDPLTLIHGDCVEVMRGMEPESVDAVVTDPPYTLGFMGRAWDATGIANDPKMWAEALRVLKPGGYLLSFGGTRTYHRMTCAIEDAGFEIRDTIAWMYGSGFPKSLDVSKAMDKRRDWKSLPALQAAIRNARTEVGISQTEAARRMGKIGHDETLGGGGFMWFESGMTIPTCDEWPRLKAALSLGDEFDGAFEEAEREVIGQHPDGSAPGGFGEHRFTFTSRDITAPATDLAKQWAGWGTALKPAFEPIVVARKPLIGTVAANVERYGTGALNIDGTRIGTNGEVVHAPQSDPNRRVGVVGTDLGISGANVEDFRAAQRASIERTNTLGRWPANVVLDEEAAAMLDEQSGQSDDGVAVKRNGVGQKGHKWLFNDLGAMPPGTPDHGFGGRGGASRFFYTAKASRVERGVGNTHPTVKPVDLMRWLCRLVTPRGGLVLDPFAGSGTTGQAALAEGFRCVLIEREAEYVEGIEKWRAAMQLGFGIGA